MIRYALRCSRGHAFDGWFRSGQEFETLRGAGHVGCPDCGATDVEKALMTPQVRPARIAPTADPAPAPQPDPAQARRAALAELRRRVEANSDYVGPRFATEARAMHAGEAPERAIHGEARLDEARALLEDGVPVLPLPFLPTRKVN